MGERYEVSIMDAEMSILYMEEFNGNLLAAIDHARQMASEIEGAASISVTQE